MVINIFTNLSLPNPRLSELRRISSKYTIGVVLVNTVYFGNLNLQKKCKSQYLVNNTFIIVNIIITIN